MPPALLTGNRLIYESRIYPTTLSFPPGGSVSYGRGLAFRWEGSQLKLLMGNYNPQVILEFDVPASRSGPMTYRRSLGTLPQDGLLRYGLHWDTPTQTLYQMQGTVYNSPTSIRAISRGRITSAGTLTSEGIWAINSTNFSYKAGMAGMTAIPDWFQDATGVGRLGIGFGGPYSGPSAGLLSFGPALAAIAPPPSGSTAPIAVTPMQEYPYLGQAWANPRHHRPTNYTQYFENCTTDAIAPGFHPLNNPAFVPINPIAGPPGNVGFWVQTDDIQSAGCWVDTPNFSGMVNLIPLSTGCLWYGNNWNFPNPCSNVVGSKAATNSTSRLHYWLITDPADLAAVATGQASKSSIQGTFTEVQFPGIVPTIAGSTSAYPMVGRPSERMMAFGMTWIPEIQRLAVGLFQASAVSGPMIYFFRVDDGGSPPPPPTLTITTSTLPTAEQTVPYAGIAYSATGGVQPYTWSQTGAPSGITMTTAGILQGTPAANGTFDVIATVTDSQPVQAQKTLSLVVVPPPTVTTLALTSGQIHVVYPGATLAVAGGTAPYVWSQTGGPTGLTLSSAGVYSGTPTQSGAFTVAVTVTDARGAIASRNLPLEIAAAPDALVITTSSLPAGQVGVVYAGATMAATGGVGPYTWSQTGGPTGLSLSAGGSYTGTPTQSGTFTVAVTVTDSAMTETTRDLLLVIAASTPPDPPPPAPPLVLTTSSLVAGVVGQPYLQTLTATGGTGPYTFTQTGLPLEIAITPSGTITGTPTQAYDQLVQIGVVDQGDPPQSTGAEFTFLVTGPTPDPEGEAPSVPQVYLPLDGATKVRRVTTNGNCVRFFAALRAEAYQVYHGTSTTPPLVASFAAGEFPYFQEGTDGYPSGSYKVDVSRQVRTTYYWRVVAINGAGVTSTAVFRYKTK